MTINSQSHSFACLRDSLHILHFEVIRYQAFRALIVPMWHVGGGPGLTFLRILIRMDTGCAQGIAPLCPTICPLSAIVLSARLLRPYVSLSPHRFLVKQLPTNLQ